MIGHVLGIGTGENWWDNMEVERGFGYTHSSQDSTYWAEDHIPAVFFADSVAVTELARVLESQGRPYDQKMIPLRIRGMNVRSTATTSDTVFKSPAHWHDCLTRSLTAYDQTAGGWVEVTGELMGDNVTSIIDPRITAPTIAALQGFTARPSSAEYMIYQSSFRDGCPAPKPDTIP